MASDVPLHRIIQGPHRSASHTLNACVCVCLNAAAGEMFVGDKDSRQSLETSGAAGKILKYSKKVSYLREGGQVDSDM